MNESTTKKCPFCAEYISSDAVKCKYCGSIVQAEDRPHRATPFDDHWRRVHEGKRLAGVCTGLAREFNSPQSVFLIRLFFVLTTFLWGFGPILYVILWLLMAPPKDVPVHEAPRDTEPGEYHDSYQPEKRRSFMDSIVGIFIIAFGLVLVMLTLSRFRLPFFSPYGIFQHSNFLFDSFAPYPFIWLIIIGLGLLVILAGAVQFLRLALGCGLVALGIVLLVAFLPFMSPLLFFPGFLILAAIFFLVGIIELFLR